MLGGYNCCYKYIVGKCLRRGESFTKLDNAGVERNSCNIDVQSLAMSEEKFWNTSQKLPKRSFIGA